MTYITESEAETAAVAREFAKTLVPGDVVAFSGGLGAGKTTFTRYMCEALDCRDDVSSPTFALVHCYRAKFPIYHFDMYRIDDEDSLDSVGYWDYLTRGGYCFVEWSEKIPYALPASFYKLEIRRDNTEQNENRRVITVSRITDAG